MKNVLIIEDDPSFRLILSKMMDQAGLEATLAVNGEVGLELFRSNHFDLVITDIIMPVMEGLETIIELHKLDPKVKIIAISGGGRMDAEKYLATAKALKVNAILKKPFSYKELLRTMALVGQEAG